MRFAPSDRQHPPIDLADAPHAHQCHGYIELLAYEIDRLGDACLAAGAEAVDIGAANQAALDLLNTCPLCCPPPRAINVRLGSPVSFNVARR